VGLHSRERRSEDETPATAAWNGAGCPHSRPGARHSCGTERTGTLDHVATAANGIACRGSVLHFAGGVLIWRFACSVFAKRCTTGTSINPKRNAVREPSRLGRRRRNFSLPSVLPPLIQEPWYLPTREGLPLDRWNLLRKQLKPVAKERGLPGVTWHLLRQSHATMLDAVGTPIGTMQWLLGHSTPDITREIYLHAIPEVQRRAVESAERLVFGPKWTQVQAPTQCTSGRVN
jgi:hypothetical protein